MPILQKTMKLLRFVKVRYKNFQNNETSCANVMNNYIKRWSSIHICQMRITNNWDENAVSVNDITIVGFDCHVATLHCNVWKIRMHIQEGNVEEINIVTLYLDITILQFTCKNYQPKKLQRGIYYIMYFMHTFFISLKYDQKFNHITCRSNFHAIFAGSSQFLIYHIKKREIYSISMAREDITLMKFYSPI